MKFESKSIYLVSKYQIDIESIITPYYDLILSLCSNVDNEHGETSFANFIIDVFDESRIQQIDYIPKDVDRDGFLAILVKYLDEQLYQQMENLPESIILLFRDKKMVISRNSKRQDVEKTLLNWVKSYNPVKKLFELVIDAKFLKVAANFEQLFGMNTCQSYVKVVDSNAWEACVINSSWLDYSDVNKSVVDPCSVWIGKVIKDSFKGLNFENLQLLEYSGRALGIQCDEIVVPFECVDDLVEAESFSFYFWEMMTHVYASVPKGKIAGKDSERFLSAGKEQGFSKLLSHLQYNIYIADDVLIPKEYVDMFEPVYCLNRLPGLENYVLFVGNPSEEDKQNNKTLSGTYEIEKTGTDYNLRNWVNATQSGYLVTKSNNEKNESCKSVYALKPQYSYYYISKYYEDYFSSILQDLQCKHRCGLELYKEGNKERFIEIDAFIEKSDGKFVYVENKTCMNKDNVEATIRKIEAFQDFISKGYKHVEIEYYLTAPYCDDSLERSFLYFMQENSKQTRDGVKHKLYDFDIPLAQFKNLSLRCIVEPEYDKMKEIVSKIVE